ncbi:ABC transporter permease [bacterium]|nr:ABC transporter permease [bacterium]MBU1983289.1 ABC transporter permease [bacterium]
MIGKLLTWIKLVHHLMRKEFRQTFRDRAMLRVIFVVPVIQLIVLSYAMTTDLKNVRISVFDEDRTKESRRLEQSFFQNETFIPGRNAANASELAASLSSGEADLTLWIPRGYAADLAAGRPVRVGIAVDGENSNSAARAAGYAEAVVRQEAQRVLDERLLRHPERQPHLIEPISRFFYNPELISQHYMVPAILVVLITVISAMLTGMAVVREKEIGTLEQLMVTPLTSGQIIAGKLLPFAMIACAELTFATTVAVFWFGVPVVGSLWLFAVCAVIYLLVTLGGGLLASTVSETQQQAMLTVWFFLMFAIMTSGVFYPIENMPDWIYYMTYANPMRFFMEITRGIFLKGSQLADILPALLPLFIMGVVTFGAAVLRFQKRVA